jgi:hypothetical protein
MAREVPPPTPPGKSKTFYILKISTYPEEMGKETVVLAQRINLGVRVAMQG